MKCKPKSISLFILLFVIHLPAEDWPQYLGPARNSTSAQKGLFRSWPKEGPEVLWTVAVGRGFGGPVISNGRVYILDRDDEKGDNLRCFNLSDGEELWNFAYDAPGSVMFPGSRSIPAVNGDYIYSCGHNGDLYCINISTHKPVWHRNVWKDFGGGGIPRWAITQNPLIYGEFVILASQAPDAGVVAYEKGTGNVKWTTPSLGPVGYVSPAIVKVDARDHVIMITASEGGGRGKPGSGGKVAGIDPLTGKILWEYTNWQCAIPVPGAVDAGENRVLITGGYEAGSAMIQIKKQADGTYGVSELYKNIDFGAHTLPPVLYHGCFYAQYTTNERRDGLVCMRLDGRIQWKTGRDPAFDKGSMILADGLILSTDGKSNLYLIEPDSTAFKPLASAELLAAPNDASDAASRGMANQNWAPMALADGRLLIRSQSQLKCVSVAK
jgi:outer membrane protein assembly factor BamB